MISWTKLHLNFYNILESFEDFPLSGTSLFLWLLGSEGFDRLFCALVEVVLIPYSSRESLEMWESKASQEFQVDQEREAIVVMLVSGCNMYHVLHISNNNFPCLHMKQNNISTWRGEGFLYHVSFQFLNAVTLPSLQVALALLGSWASQVVMVRKAARVQLGTVGGLVHQDCQGPEDPLETLD